MDAWREFYARQEQYLEAHRDLEAAIEAAERRTADTALGGPRKALEAAASDQAGYTALGRPQEPCEPGNEAILEDLARVMASFPECLRAAEHSPYEAIVRQYERLTARAAGGQNLTSWEATEFQRAVAHSIERFRRDARNRAEQRRRNRARLEKLLDEALVHEALAPPEFEDQTTDISKAIARLLASETPQAIELDLLEKRMADLAGAIKTEIARRARLDALTEALERNLAEMEYATQAAPALHESGRMQQMTMRIPGGELVRLAVHDDGHLGFEVCHEQANAGDILTDADRAHLRKQEARWCDDFRLLIRRMLEEGFEYEVRFEKKIPDEAIKVAVIERVEDLLRDEAGHRRRQSGGMDEICLS